MPERDLETIRTRINSAEDALQDRREDWYDYYKLYRSYREDKGDTFSNLFIPHIFTNIEQIAPRIVSTVVENDPIFSIQPRKAEEVKASFRAESLINYQLEFINFIKKLIKIEKTNLIYGTAIAKSQWREDFDKLPGQEEKQLGYEGPSLDSVSLFDFFPDPHATELSNADYVIERYFVTQEQLEEWQEEGVVGPNAGGESVSNVKTHKNRNRENDDRIRRLNDVGKRSGGRADTTRDWIEIHEYWEPDHVQFVANEDVVIRSNQNPFINREYPYFVFRDYPQDNEFYGIGEVENVKDLQHEINTQRNMRIDARSFSLNPILQVSPGAMVSNDELEFESGKIWRVDPGQVQPFALPDTGTPSVEEEQLAVQNIKETTSVTDVIRGLQTSKFPETATGVSTLDTNASTRFNMKLRVIEEPLKEFARHMVSMNQQFMTERKMVRITGQSQTSDPRIEEEDVTTIAGDNFLTADPTNIKGSFDYKVKAAESINKKQRQQRYMQVLNVGSKFASEFNVQEVMKRLFESMGVKDVDKILQVPDGQVDRLSQVEDRSSGPGQGEGPRPERSRNERSNASPDAQASQEQQSESNAGLGVNAGQ